MPADGLPYIGRMTGFLSNVYVATGYYGTGMIFGTLAGSILNDIICGRKNKYHALFDPRRIKPLASFSQIIESAPDTIGNLLGIKVEKEKIEMLAEVVTGQGKLVKYDGKTVGVYRDNENTIHMANSSCTHIHCTVARNASEKSWDCPCHGSRFSAGGELLNGPARKNLENIG